MSGAPSVLYDAPGPKARMRNIIYTVLFAPVLAAVIAWVIITLSNLAELAPSKWKPFVTEDVWTTFLLPGLWQTLKAAALSLVIALPVGAILGLGPAVRPCLDPLAVPRSSWNSSGPSRCCC